ncbi:hypothetical protein [Psychroflexus maritimus]|uniref:DUF4258 domain-containing protein n=1 Tax=Psychroflexus maritimus TaxID=2714865 RepID=A0A967DYF7_9FLAO|nr:hypothetical protein [Psychroflexus maritimus]NGZ89073.1 hypothetical protein [Psychroflexus maritimus]
MKFVKRLGYYLSGFAIGLVFLFFFLSGKKTSCDYSPNARVKKNIRIKDRVISNQAWHFFESQKIDTASIASLLNNGNVDFKKSNTQLDSCKRYHIEGQHKELKLGMVFENCDSIARVLDAFRVQK